MSKVNKTETAIKQPEVNLETVADEEVTAEDSSIGSSHSRRVVVSWSGSSDELKHGATVKITNGEKLFRPNFDVEKLDDESKNSMKKLDFAKGIVTNIKLKSIYSNVDDSVTMSMNLYKNKPQIVNNAGHLFAPTKTDMGVSHEMSVEGFENLANILPYEKARMDTSVYEPSNLLNNRFIEQYGGYDLDSLWRNVISFPQKDYYYVAKDSIVLKVVSRNWEILGMSLDAERQREGEYIKVAKDVVNNVISQLYTNVIQQIPYTAFDDLSVRFQSNSPSESDTNKIVAEFFVEYKFPMVKDEANGTQEMPTTE